MALPLNFEYNTNFHRKIDNLDIEAYIFFNLRSSRRDNFLGSRSRVLEREVTIKRKQGGANKSWLGVEITL